MLTSGDRQIVDIASCDAEMHVENLPATHADGGLLVHVTNPGGGEGGGGLTDAELRAAPVPVSGTVSVNEPVTVDGTVAVSNFPATQPVSGTFWPGTQPVSGTVTANAGTGPFPVSDNGGSLTVDGSVSVSNFPATQPVSGTVAVSNFPATQPVTDNGGSLTVDGTVGVSGTVTVKEAPNAWTWASVHSTTVTVNTVFVDTGQLAAGTYDFDIILGIFALAGAGLGVIVEHRNAANNATVQTVGACASGDSLTIQLRNYVIATNERLRVTNPVALAASSRTTAAIGRRLSA